MLVEYPIQFSVNIYSGQMLIYVYVILKFHDFTANIKILFQDINTNFIKFTKINLNPRCIEYFVRNIIINVYTETIYVRITCTQKRLI